MCIGQGATYQHKRQKLGQGYILKRLCMNAVQERMAGEYYENETYRYDNCNM
jgi:hypothetical protein